MKNETEMKFRPLHYLRILGVTDFKKKHRYLDFAITLITRQIFLLLDYFSLITADKKIVWTLLGINRTKRK